MPSASMASKGRKKIEPADWEDDIDPDTILNAREIIENNLPSYGTDDSEEETVVPQERKVMTMKEITGMHKMFEEARKKKENAKVAVEKVIAETDLLSSQLDELMEELYLLNSGPIHVVVSKSGKTKVQLQEEIESIKFSLNSQISIKQVCNEISVFQLVVACG